MEEIINLIRSAESYTSSDSLFDGESTDSVSTDSESTDKELNDKESTDKELNDKELNDKELNDKELNDKELNDKELNDNELNDKESTDRELNDNNDNQINLNNQQSKTKSINQNLFNSSSSNKSADSNNEKTELIDNLLFEDEWTLKMDFNFRVELIKLLDEYTRLLVSNHEILTNEKELIKKSKNDLIKLLSESPLKLDEESKFYEIFINFDNIFKHSIIDQLIKNENLIIYYKNKIDTKLKNRLIFENNYLITRLINLPVHYYNNDVSLVDDEELKSNQSENKGEKVVNKLQTKFSNLQNETINLKQEINKLKRNLDDEKLINKKFKNQLNEFKNEMNQNSIKFYCVKKDMKNFFKNDNEFYSQKIIHQNIKWFIRIRSKYDDKFKKKFLQFYLHVDNEIDDENNVKWNCTTSYDVILRNHISGKEDIISKLNEVFNKSIGIGLPNFVSEEELFNLENGFLKDDTIKLEVNLKVNKIERNIVIFN